MNYDIKKCGERIRQLRIKNGLTQEKVAGVLNVDRSVYSRIEAGKSGCAVDSFVQLSELFNVSLDYLILGKYGGAVLENTERTMLKESIEQLIRIAERLPHIDNFTPAVRVTTRTDERPAAHATTRRGQQSLAASENATCVGRPLAGPSVLTLSEFIMRRLRPA